jgi:hypothetical protein
VEALEKGYTAFAKAVKSFTSSERYKRSERLVSAGFCILLILFFFLGCCSDGTMFRM